MNRSKLPCLCFQLIGAFPIMLESLLNRLEKERRVIKGAPIHFSFACLIAVIILGLLWYAAFGTALSLQHSTIEAYKQKFGDISNPKDFASMENISDFFVSQPITNFDGTNLFLT